MRKVNQEGIGATVVILILLVAGVIGFAGWKVWESKSDSTDRKQNSTQSDSTIENKGTQNTEPKAATEGVVITTGDSEFGTMLFNDKKQAIYIWELEESVNAECYGDCAELWPPVLTNGAPRTAGSVNGELLGTTKRTDGTRRIILTN